MVARISAGISAATQRLSLAFWDFTWMLMRSGMHVLLLLLQATSAALAAHGEAGMMAGDRLAKNTTGSKHATHHHNLVHCVLRESRSHEDIVLLPLLLEAASVSGRRTFTELGAYDGISGSQSYLLEKCFGWTGVLIEASPQNFDKLNQTQRSRRTHKEHSAVCNGTGTLDVMGGGGTVAGVASDFARSFARQWNRAHADCGGMPCVSKVPCRPLPSIIEDAGFPAATFLSLDVEGGEEKVLQTVRPEHDAFPFDVVMVEADRHDHRKNARVQSMLLHTWGLLQHPIQQSPGSTNQLYARPTIRDVRPNATTLEPLRAIANSAGGRTKLLHHIGQLRLSPFVNETLRKTPHLLIGRLIEGLPQQMSALLDHMATSEVFAKPEPEEDAEEGLEQIQS